MFANMYTAYETLSPGMQRLLDGMRAVNSSALADVSKTREDRIRDTGDDDEQQYLAEHPVVRTHPETGRKALYVNPAHTASFVDLTEDESRPLLEYLFAALHPARVHLPVPVGGGLARPLGQPLHDAQPDQRLPRLHAGDAPHHARRRRPALSRRP